MLALRVCQIPYQVMKILYYWFMISFQSCVTAGFYKVLYFLQIVGGSFD